MTIRFGNVTVVANIGADGTFSKDVPYQVGARQNATATLKGRITRGALEADLETSACQQHYSLKKE